MNGILMAGSYMGPINNLVTVLETVAAGIGAVMLVYGGIKFAMSFRNMDQQGEHQAVYTIVAGAILIGITALIGALM